MSLALQAYQCCSFTSIPHVRSLVPQIRTCSTWHPFPLAYDYTSLWVTLEYTSYQAFGTSNAPSSVDFSTCHLSPFAFQVHLRVHHMSILKSLRYTKLHKFAPCVILLPLCFELTSMLDLPVTEPKSIWQSPSFASSYVHYFKSLST